LLNSFIFNLVHFEELLEVSRTFEEEEEEEKKERECTALG
jgi:hypothetical protein